MDPGECDRSHIRWLPGKSPNEGDFPRFSRDRRCCRASGNRLTSAKPKKHLLVEDQMNRTELEAAEEIVVETIEQAVELTLPELDMVGGGGMASVLL